MKKYIDFNTEKEQMMLTVLKKTFLIWWSILFMVKLLKIYEKESMSD